MVKKMSCGVCGKDIRYLQYVAAFCVGILDLSAYMTASWISPVMPLLTAENSPIGVTLTNDEVSWVAACFGLGFTVGSILIPLLFDRIGPKRILLLSSAFIFLMWICVGLAKSIALLVVGRFIAGLGAAIKTSCYSIYICEIANKDIRGKLGTIPVLVAIWGNIFILTAGPYLEYSKLIIICAIFPVIFFFIFSFIPDSPYYLLKTGRKNEAQLSLTRFSRSSASVEEIKSKLQEIEETIRKDMDNLTLKQSLCAPNFRKSLIIVCVANMIVSFCGISFITTYLQVIVASANTALSPKMASVIFGLIQIPSVISSMLLLDKLGRKAVFCVSSLGAALAIICEGIYLYLQDKINLDSVAFLPILFLTVYKFSISFGVLHLPFFFIGEFFTTQTKKVAAFIVAGSFGFFTFLNIKILGSLFDSWGIYTMCWIFGGVSISGIIFALLVLPETKGKELTIIQNDLSQTKIK
ncbi:hypothetical protein RI129_006673 [Pyrocoelia pectoralis]|uniref:Major facilitator superfamily (MFS) profile domain-containing protein n=1 Tax=Pyrocoelia pectoralis TaxID=417401 RepID=A0AAN7VEL4_9COLE